MLSFSLCIDNHLFLNIMHFQSTRFLMHTRAYVWYFVRLRPQKSGSVSRYHKKWKNMTGGSFFLRILRKNNYIVKHRRLTMNQCGHQMKGVI